MLDLDEAAQLDRLAGLAYAGDGTTENGTCLVRPPEAASAGISAGPAPSRERSGKDVELRRRAHEPEFHELQAVPIAQRGP
jgi:hypothetical protein